PCALQCTHDDARSAPDLQNAPVWAAITGGGGFFQGAAHQIGSSKRPKIVLDPGRVVVAEAPGVELRSAMSDVLSRTHGWSRSNEPPKNGACGQDHVS